MNSDYEQKGDDPPNADRDSCAAAERVLHGLPASPGIAIGRAYLYEREELTVEELTLSDDQVAHEQTVWREAVARANKELTKILDFAQERLGQAASTIFEGQLLMLNDVELQSSMERRIAAEKRNADFLLKNEIEKYLAVLVNADDEHLRERVLDLRDVKQRLIRNIQRRRLRSTLDETARIVIAHSLTPADTVLFSKNDVLAYATDTGGITSHTAILARSLNIPAIVGLHTAVKEVVNDAEVIVDGYSGTLIIHPTPSRLEEYNHKIAKIKALEDSLAGIAKLPCVTTDGKKVELAANAEFIDELDTVIMQGSRGIGLYRTEHLYLARAQFPSEEEQFEAYRTIAQRVYPLTVIFRTFDIGSDKVLASEEPERNPALGWRGTRVMLDSPDVFETQLRAILRASIQKNVKIMFPMISGLDELRAAMAHLENARASLRAKKIRFDAGMEIGVMIEVPAAILLADQLAKHVSFFSIGTNDLIQYVLAVDRCNDRISDLYQEFHPAVLHAIKHVIDVGHANGIWVGMCGAMAGEINAAMLLLGMGLDEYSVVPSVIPMVKNILRSVSHADARALADRCLSMNSARDIRACLTEEMQQRFPELYIARETIGSAHDKARG